jgi:rubrerythrin
MAATGVEASVHASPLAAGVKVKGEYRCAGCGYGVTIYRELPSCPMCGSDAWEQLAWSPFTRPGGELNDLLGSSS